MVRIVFLLILAMSTGLCRAQTLSQFKLRLMQTADSIGYARVRVTEHGSAAEAVRTLSSLPVQTNVKGYRIHIFSDNGQNAKIRASETMNNFRALFPSIPCYISYDTPYFKVAVGNCVSIEDAVVLKGRVEASFPHAFVSKETIPISEMAD